MRFLLANLFMIFGPVVFIVVLRLVLLPIQFAEWLVDHGRR